MKHRRPYVPPPPEPEFTLAQVGGGVLLLGIVLGIGAYVFQANLPALAEWFESVKFELEMFLMQPAG